MITPSKRAACQRYFEEKFGVSSSDELGLFQNELQGYRITLADEVALRACWQSDASASFERATLSLLQAVCDLERGDRLWPAVKFYYSIFYLLRSEIYLGGLVSIRAGNVFIVRCQQGQICKKYKGRPSGDHALAIQLFEREYKNSDIMLSQSIEGKSVYSWMKSVREDVQYKLRRPPELERFDPFFSDEHWEIGNQIETFIADNDPIYCFDPDYGALAIPIKRFQLTAEKFRRDGIKMDKQFCAYVGRYFKAGLQSNKFKALMPI